MNCKQIEERIIKDTKKLMLLEQSSKKASDDLLRIIVDEKWDQAKKCRKHVKRLFKQVVNVVHNLFMVLIKTPGPKALPEKILNKCDQITEHAVRIENLLKDSLVLLKMCLC